MVETNRNHVIQVRVTATEHDAYKRAAIRAGLALSEFARRKLFGLPVEELTANTIPAPTGQIQAPGGNGG